jgi:NAD(P)-dependent dehydrogenase (short-subunit alcohol dehydrogenase family)
MATKDQQKNNSQRDLEGKVAIVTGAASGIGRATAQLFESRGAKVIAEDINPAVGELASNENIVPFVGDVASEDSAKRVVALAIEHFGTLDILVNNAATIKYTRVLDLTLEEWNNILSVNLTGAFLHSREAVRVMAPKNSGAIVNIGSYACFFGFPQIGPYAASKGGLAQLTRVLAVESIPHGIRVNAVGAVTL